MDSNSLKNSNIIIDYNIKDSKGHNPNIKKITKNKNKKIKYLYIDSNELTKDETSNILEKNIDGKEKNIKQNDENKNKNKIISLKDKTKIKIVKFKKCTSNDKDYINTEIKPEISKDRNNKIYKIKNFKYFNKKDINDILQNKTKTLNEKEEKKNKTKIYENQNNKNNGCQNDEDELKQREHNTKDKLLYNINANSFNEEDLFNKIKKINIEKYMMGCYQYMKNNEEKNDAINYNNNNKKENQKLHKHIQYRTDNLFFEDNLSEPKNLNSFRSKMKAYTKISKIIKNNIIEKENKFKKKEIKQNYIINKNNKKILNIDLNQDENDTIKNKTNFNLKDCSEEKNYFEDIPQRRPGCCTEKNLSIINKENEKINTKVHNTTNSHRKRIIKNNNNVSLQPKFTFIKSLKVAKLFNGNENKGKNCLKNNFLSNIVQKFQTQKSKNNNNSNIKIKQNSNKHNKTKTNNIRYLNLKDRFYKSNNINNNSNSSNNKLSKPLNFTLIDSKCIKLYETKFGNSIKNNSFSFGFKKSYYNSKINRISIIKKFYK